MEHLAGWRSVLGGSGGQCVMILGIISMQLLSVDNLDSVQKVSHSGVNDRLRKCFFLSIQLQVLASDPIVTRKEKSKKRCRVGMPNNNTNTEWRR